MEVRRPRVATAGAVKVGEKVVVAKEVVATEVVVKAEVVMAEGMTAVVAEKAVGLVAALMAAANRWCWCWCRWRRRQWRGWG